MNFFKRTWKASLLLVAFAIMTAPSLFAQKLGYTNSAALIVSLPETESADQSLKSLEDDLITEATQMEQAFQTKVEAYYQDANSGALTPVQMQEKEAVLQAEQQALIAFQQEALEKVRLRREELYGPILNKLQTAIDEVAQENGYLLIFDVSVMNLVLYADESDDVTELIKAKL